ncbi:hypothetical protein PR202_ga31001 [Eleusine coracana subsp. coracana]|uniref:Uncharacterized protein n=1 Tax=Eleusine coracana subsp. coracana TaxID=191504 RepID=A0AAV5DRA7_ELECO|nr:hypothetical protein PR202_ga31001 [Eleusine coracana subsp. coracana]
MSRVFVLLRVVSQLLGDSPAVYNAVTDESKALAQALQEKMEVLMLFSQEQERYLFEKQRSQIIIEDLQKNLSQVVKDENVKVLMELAKLKEEYLLLKGLKVENATLMDSVGTLERLTSSVHRLHVVLLKPTEGELKSSRADDRLRTKSSRRRRKIDREIDLDSRRRRQLPATAALNPDWEKSPDNREKCSGGDEKISGGGEKSSGKGEKSSDGGEKNFGGAREDLRRWQRRALAAASSSSSS